MVVINNLEIINNGTQIAIDVETSVGFNITSILLWQMNDFKDYSLAKNLTPYLEQINNKEVLIIDAVDLSLAKFEDIVFVEVESDDPGEDDCTTCQPLSLGITYNLMSYYQCLMNYFFENNDSKNDCKSCNDVNSSPEVLTINLLLDMVENALELGYYLQAIDMIKKLKKLCSIKNCTNCGTVECSSCSKFKQF